MRQSREIGDALGIAADDAPFVSVAVRVKPTFGSDQPRVIWAKDSSEDAGPCRTVCCNRGYLMEEYEFSRVFGPGDDNRALYDDLGGTNVVGSIFGGVNETLFAYGQTGSGKTHTIFGATEEHGLLYFFVHSIFERAKASPSSTIHVSCYEVLGDTLTDLVDTASLAERGDLRPEDIVTDELFLKTQKYRYQIVRVGDIKTMLDLLQTARGNRTVGVSSYNNASSRSHAIVHIFVQNPLGENNSQQEATSIGALTLVDLAGAEKEHENPSEQGRKTARLLNTSLSSLNRLLRKLQTNSLNESERRQSVLNKCLWEYLRPGCGIALIFCVSPLMKHRTITLSTLAMATDSKTISSKRKSQYIQTEFRPPKPQRSARPRSPSPAPTPKHSSQRGTPSCRTPTAAPAVDAEGLRAPTPGGPGTPTLGGGGGATYGSLEEAAPLPSFETLVSQSFAMSLPTSERSQQGPPFSPSARFGDCTPTARGATPTSLLDTTQRVVQPHYCGSSPAAVERQRLSATEQHQQQPQSSLPSRSRTASITDPDSEPSISQLSRLTEPMTSEEVDRLCGHDLRSPVAVRSLAIQNTKLRRKLSRARAVSRDRMHQVQHDQSQVMEENAMLRKECESLRELFIRQQQQQIAFWTGPFMEMIGPQERHGGSSGSVSADVTLVGSSSPSVAAAAAAAQQVAAAERLVAEAAAGASVAGATDSSGTGTLEARPRAPNVEVAESAREEAVRSLRQERDYWRSMASELKRERAESARGGHKSRGNGRETGSEVSTSSLHHGSEHSPTAWSDSGDDLSTNLSSSAYGATL